MSKMTRISRVSADPSMRGRPHTLRIVSSPHPQRVVCFRNEQRDGKMRVNSRAWCTRARLIASHILTHDVWSEVQ